MKLAFFGINMISILLINFWKKPGMADRTWKILSGIEVGIIVLMAFTIFLMMSDSVIVLECLGNSVCGPD